MQTQIAVKFLFIFVTSRNHNTIYGCFVHGPCLWENGLRHWKMFTSTAKIARKNWPCRTAGKIDGWPTILANAEPQIEIAACHPARFARAYFEFGLSANCCALWRRLEPTQVHIETILLAQAPHDQIDSLDVKGYDALLRKRLSRNGLADAASLEATKMYIGHNRRAGFCTSI